MTKAEAINQFKEIYTDYLEENKKDRVAIRTAWNDYTDFLMKDGDITEFQCNTWAQPF